MKRYLANLPIFNRYFAVLQRMANIESILDIILLNENHDVLSKKCAFNGQVKRKSLVEVLFEKIHFQTYVETGTFIGLTSRYMATRYPTLKIRTCEINPFNCRIASYSLGGLGNVLTKQMSSLDYLCCADLVAECKNETVFFYLDAHWGVENPLRDEIRIIRTFYKSYLIVIDDFKVEGDPGFGWDRGFTPSDDNRLENISDLLGRDAGIYFPYFKPEEDAGAKRGLVVICSQDLVAELSGIDLLKKVGMGPESI